MSVVGEAQDGANNAAINDDQACDHSPFRKVDALVNAREGQQRAADLGSRGVAVGVQDAGQRVCAFASAQQFAALGIEGRAPLDKFSYADWPLIHKRLGSRAKDNPIACAYGVFEMQRNVPIAFHGDGDSALRVVGVGLGERFLGDDQDIAVAGQFNGCAKAGHARAHHQKIYPRRHCHNL